MKVVRVIETVAGHEMKCGEIAEIVHHDNRKHIGAIVQRVDSVLVTLGKSSSHSFPGIDVRFKILPAGTILEL